MQARYLKQLDKLQHEYHGIPILCAGDVFDRWDSPPELINFAIEHLPVLHAVPGQHDLPNHSYDQIRRSAYWTLVEAGKITSLSDRHRLTGIIIYAFPWGRKVTTTRERPDPPDKLRVALIHSYIWWKGHRHGGINPASGRHNEQHLDRWIPKLEGYDVALFGDNHKGFQKSLKCYYIDGRGLTIYNNGTFIRRHSDERDFAPRVGVVYSDGYVQERYLDTSGDVFVDDPKEDAPAEVIGLDAGELLELLRRQGDATVQFAEAVRHYLREQEGLTAAAKKLITELLEKAHARTHG